jgi:phage major head subunit gpT-like protein
MPVITRDQVTLEAGVLGAFNRAYMDAEATAMANVIATRIETTLPTQNYDWWGQLPTLREWTDERTFRSMTRYRYTISDRVYEASIQVERRALEDDQLDALWTKVRDLGQQAVRDVDRMLVEFLLAGFNTVGPDGQYFFDIDHAESGSTQSNVTSGSLSASALRTAITTMMSFRGDANRPLGITPTHLLVGPSQFLTARELVESPVVVATSGTNYANVLAGIVQVLVTPYIPGNQWFLLDLSRPIKPLILQVRSDVPDEVVIHSDPSNSPIVFMQDIVAVGVRKRFGIGYGLWQLAYGSSG